MLCDLIDHEFIQGLVIWSTVVGAFLSEAETEEFCDQYGQHIPIVTLESKVGTYPYIPIDDYGGMHNAITHLIKVHGYRRIAFINFHEKHIGFQERYQAYRDALAQYDLTFDPDLVLPQMPMNKAHDEVLDEWLPGVLEAGADAIVGVADRLAIIAMQWLQARGTRIPEDMAVIGFDDAAESRVVTPSLTTARGQFYEMGRQGVETLLAVLAGEPDIAPPPIPSPLMVRRSCGCVDETVALAAVEPTEAVGNSLHAALNTSRESIVVEMVQVTERSARSPEWTEQLLEAFVADIEQEVAGNFVSMLEEVLQQVIAVDQDITIWQNAISVLCRRLLPYLSERDILIHALGLWQQARVIISNKAGNWNQSAAFWGEPLSRRCCHP